MDRLFGNIGTRKLCDIGKHRIAPSLGASEEIAMDLFIELQTAALRHAEQVDRNDARVWRWYAEAVDEGRLACQYQRGFWHIVLDGLAQANDRSFDIAVRVALDIDRSTTATRNGVR